ncbi:MAG: molybdopterin dinucleotide binding domain-containing protein, partial [Pseudomonadota bacterium]
FGAAFDYTAPVDVFREYARLSTLNNQGTRDFDIGSMSDLTDAAYESLQPVQWPQASGTNHATTRFFANGKFYTPDQKARFITVEAKASRVTSDELQFVLNTGRVRDHWHTMTRTASAARLSSHMAEPYCEIHPQDARSIGIANAELVEVSNPFGTITVRALISDKAKPGSVFVPMHWTDQFASQARVDSLVPARVDPFSGQPASKNVAVRVRRAKVGAYGFLVSSEKPDFKNRDILYWATARCDGGWRSEVAFASRRDAMRFGDSSAIDANGNLALDYNDPVTAGHRVAVFEAERLKLAVYLSNEPVLLAREWLVGQLGRSFENASDCQKVLAGRADAAMPDKGPVVCSCLGVGSYEILSAIHAGNITVQEVGHCTGAGTNCGSCRAEITGMINSHVQETKIAAE